jgi:hypothetical protein
MTPGERECVVGALSGYKFVWWFMSEAYEVPGECRAELVVVAEAEEKPALRAAHSRLVASGYLNPGYSWMVWTSGITGQWTTTFQVKLDLTKKNPRHLAAPAFVARLLLTEALGQGPSW